MKLATVGMTMILLVLGDSALACRPGIVNPLDHIARDGTPEFTAVFVGEIVGLRKPQRIEALRRRWRDLGDQADHDGHQLMRMTVGGGLDLQLEVFPTEVLRGEPDLPHTVTLSGCVMPSPEPELGAVGVVFVTEDGWGKFERRDDESGYGVDAGYIEEVRSCLTGDCDREE